MGKRIVLRMVALAGLGLVGSGAAYASLFGEENVTLVQQLVELMGISQNTYETLRETRKAVDLMREGVDDVRRARNLVSDLHSYTADRFIDDFKRDVLKTYPDLDYIIQATSAEGLARWRDSNLRSPMGSYELIGHVFGEMTEELRDDKKRGEVKIERPVLYRYEAATSLATAASANSFIDKADADIEVLTEALDGATEEEAVVLQAKMQAVVAAQNSHVLRLLARSIRREGIQDALHYEGAVLNAEASLEFSSSEGALQKEISELPKLMTFEDPY